MDTNKYPLVSVIIPAYNAAGFIAATLDSILSQTYPYIEILVVDDGSTDDTARIVSKYGAKVHYLYQPNSGGCSVPRNNGVRHCNGDLLCFFDADDLMLPDRIQQQVDCLYKIPEIGISVCDYQNFSHQGLREQSHFHSCSRLMSIIGNHIYSKVEGIIARRLLLIENFSIAGNILVKKSLFAQEAGFNETLTSCEDFHLIFRLARHSAIGIVNQVGFHRRFHEGNMSSNRLRMLNNYLSSRILLRETEFDATVREGLDRFIANCHSLRGRFYADNKQSNAALKDYWRSYSLAPCKGQASAALLGVVRTLAIATGLHRVK